MAMSPQQQTLNAILFRYDQEGLQRMRAAGNHVVHYTSAANALQIIRGRTLWLRNSKLMNDFSEVQYGKWCVAGALDRIAGPWIATLDSIHEGLARAVLERFNQLEDHRIAHTFILSLSEHLPQEDQLGRLSMWRAYGGDGGVALVFDNAIFDQDPADLNIYSCLVLYTDQDGYTAYLTAILEQMRQVLDSLRVIPLEALVDSIAGFLHFAVLSTKHPAFAEEREIRLITGVNMSAIAKLEIETVRGVPQIVWKLPLEDQPDKSYLADPRRILRRIVVGPVIEPPIVNEAFRMELARQDWQNADQIVHTSWVPLRTSL